MIDVDKLRYDLALQSAVVMTLRNLDRAFGNPPDLMLNNFLLAYRQYGEGIRIKRLNDAIKELEESE